MQSLHRVRERWIMRRTAVVNQIRGLLLERGITVRTGRCHLDAALPNILEDARPPIGNISLPAGRTEAGTGTAGRHIEQAETLIQRARTAERSLPAPGSRSRGSARSRPLHIAAIGNGGAFRKGREFAAWVGWFPANTPPEASRSFSASASAATVICGNCLFRAHVRF